MSNEVSKLNFEIIPNERIFRFFLKFSQAMDEVEIFFANFQILGPLGCPSSQTFCLVSLIITVRTSEAAFRKDR